MGSRRVVIDLDRRRGKAGVREEFTLLIGPQGDQARWVRDFERRVLVLLPRVAVDRERIFFYDIVPILLGLFLHLSGRGVCLRCEAVQVDGVVLHQCLLRPHVALHVYCLQFREGGWVVQ